MFDSVKHSGARIGVFGGTFDPPHNGHVQIARAACEQCALDVLYVMPAGMPVYKLDKKVTPAPQRLEMCKLAFAWSAGAGNTQALSAAGTSENIQVSDAEIARGGKTYTAHTLQALHEENPDAELFFIAGADAAATIPKWRDSQTIARLATIVVFGRSDLNGSSGVAAAFDESPASVGEPAAFEDLVNNFHVVFLSAKVQTISSSEIRDAVRKGNDISTKVPKSVSNYIESYKLYV